MTIHTLIINVSQRNVIQVVVAVQVTLAAANVLEDDVTAFANEILDACEVALEIVQVLVAVIHQSHRSVAFVGILNVGDDTRTYRPIFKCSKSTFSSSSGMASMER